MTLTELIDRLEGATGPDAWADAGLHGLIEPGFADFPRTEAGASSSTRTSLASTPPATPPAWTRSSHS